MRERLSSLTLLTAYFRQNKIVPSLTILSIAFILILSSNLYADGVTQPNLNVEEEDGSPSTYPYKLKVTNGTLTDNGDNTASLTTGGGAGGGDPVLIDGTGVTDASGVDLQGGAGIDITFNAAASPDTASFILDLTEISTATFGSGTFTTITIDAGVTDPIFTFGSDSLAITNAATFTIGGNAVSHAATAFGGDITGTIGATVVGDDSHAHTTTTISGVDISADTNLAGDTENVLTGDALSIGATITRDAEWDTEGEVQTAWGIVNILLETEIDASSELLAIMDDETGTGLLAFATSPNFTTDIGFANSADDDVLAAAGDSALNTLDEQLSFHSAADGEISGEASISLLRHIVVTFDPSGYYDQETTYRTLPIMEIGDDSPEGITITEWRMRYSKGDPTTEIDCDLMCDTTPDYNPAAGATVMDVLDTTTGASSADTGFDSATCANGAYMYLRFGADPTDANVVTTFNLWFYNEED